MLLKRMILGGLAVGAALMQSPGKAEPQAEGRAFEFAFEAINGKPFPLSDLKGRVLLVVNTASFCGFTKQYAGMQKLWETYRDRGLTVIGVPSNDFYQESEDPAKIAEFCKGAFGVTFPLTAKYSVIGGNAHPFYQWANGLAGDGGMVRWNFHKYLISADGKLAAYFPTMRDPMSKIVTDAIEAELAKRPAS
jgi:glutathione peroxidase